MTMPIALQQDHAVTSPQTALAAGRQFS